MDYSNSVGVKIMKPIAEAKGCNYVPFGQMKLIGEVESQIKTSLKEGNNGICYGLSVAWLEAMHKSKDNAAFVSDVSSPTKSSVFYRAYSAYRHQQTYKGISASGTMHGADWSTRDQFFGEAAIVQNNVLRSTGKTEDFNCNLGSLKALTAWFCAAMSPRYFMLSIPNHAMAAIGSKTGRCHFFDPNAGMVYAMSANRVAKCMFDFFSNATITKSYRTSEQGWLTATKFK